MVVRERIASVEKYQRLKPDVLQVTNDEIWIPAFDEVFGEEALYYELFQNSAEKRVKKRNDSAAWWWLRSATNFDYFYAVGNSGSGSGYGAGYAGGVALGFCL
jgi:hypothetical protein